ncbi:MAG: ABC transporter ATP-binding protein [Firmicutes bacterium]|nr:ABC transporter ATP-binding protein [Bacillota bacterium]
MPEIVLSNISKVFPGVQEVVALADINLTVKDGEFLSILGPSGCGKSTLLEIIAGLQLASSGEVLVDGKSVDEPSPDIGVVFQDSSLYPWRSVIENIELGPEIRGIPRRSRREVVEKYIDMVKLKGFEKRYPHQLSGGMRQRVGLARSLANNPRVLLMDEPFAAVDHLTRLQLQDDLLEIWGKEKKTIVFITHDVTEAVFLGDRVVLLTPRPGQIQKIFAVPVKRPRSRGDPELLAIQDKIYRLIYGVRSEEDLEYIL